MPDQPFRLEEATIDELHRAIQAGQTTCVAVVQHYIDRARAYNGVCQHARDRRRRTGSRGQRRGARDGAAALSDRDRQGRDDPARSRQIPRPAARIRPHGSRPPPIPSVQQQYGMITGIPNAGQLNALATLNIRGERSVTCRGDFDRHPSRGAAAAGRAAGLRDVPPAARRARTRSRTRRALRPQSRPRRRCRCTASSSRSRTRSTPRTCAPPPAATRPTTSIFRRATTCWSSSCATRARSSSPRRSAPNTTAAPADPGGRHKPEKDVAVGLGLSAQQLGRQPGQPLRHDARGLARLELGVGRVGQRQSGHVQPRRGNPRLDAAARPTTMRWR